MTFLHPCAWQWHRGLLSWILQITMSRLEAQRRALRYLLPVLPCREVVVLVLNATFLWSRMYWTPRGPETWATKLSSLNSACHSGKIIWIPSNCRVLYVIICLYARAWQWHRGFLSWILQITGSCLEVQRRALLNLLPVLPWGEVVFLVFNATFVWSRMYWTPWDPEIWVTKHRTLN